MAKRLAFTGKRDIREQDKATLVRALSAVFADTRDIEVAHSGGAVGFDTLVAQWAKRQPKFEHILHVPMQYQVDALAKALNYDEPAHFKRCGWCTPGGKNAHYQRRNEHMVDSADIVLAYYYGGTGGTYNCIRYALAKGVPVYNLLTGTYITSL